MKQPLGDFLMRGPRGEEKGNHIMTVAVDMKALLEAGSHFGHKTSRWHPKMAPYIHSKKQGAHIINLEKTVEALEKALPAITEIAKSDKKVLFVGTKKQMKEIVKAAAESVEMPYVTVRWVGGTLTNVETVNRQIRKLKDLEKRMASGELENRYSKLEVQRFQEEIDLLNERYGGIKNMSEQPAAIIIVDANEDKNAIKEAKNLNIPVFAIVDTNVDPTGIDYVIPANDDAIKSTQLILDYITAAIKEGRK
ncbi:30S ribosomal protein S2 [Candidatus Saccharibacteria bacterium]|nr:30S ribosomal protein S2 [Candidatus Saccharibacteria bacterium]